MDDGKRSNEESELKDVCEFEASTHAQKREKNTVNVVGVHNVVGSASRRGLVELNYGLLCILCVHMNIKTRVRPHITRHRTRTHTQTHNTLAGV